MVDDLRAALKRAISKMSLESRSVYERDVELLAKSGITTYESLCLAVDGDLDIEIKQVASWALGTLGGPQALAALLRALEAEESELSFEAAKSLASLATEDSLPRIRTIMMTGESPHSRAAAAYVLGMLGDKGSVDSLIEVLAGRDVPEVRSHAAEALGHISDKRAMDSLLSALNDEAEDVRFWSAFALGEIGDPRAIPQLEKLATTDRATIPNWGSVRQEARIAMKRIQD